MARYGAVNTINGPLQVPGALNVRGQVVAYNQAVGAPPPGVPQGIPGPLEVLGDLFVSGRLIYDQSVVGAVRRGAPHTIYGDLEVLGDLYVRGPIRSAAGVNGTVVLARFTATLAAPLPNPLPVDVGALAVVDTNGILSQAGGRLVVSGTNAALDRLTSGPHLRKAGRAFLLALPTRVALGAGGATRWGWGSSESTSNLDIGVDNVAASTTAIRIKTGGSAIDASVTIGSGEQHYAFVMRAVGGFVLARNGASGPYTLLWVYNAGTSDEYTRLLLSAADAKDFTADDFCVTDLVAPWTTDYGIATSRIATTANDDTSTSLADAVVEHTITAATGVVQELSVRRTADTDRWVVRMDQTGSTIKLMEIVAGVETERSSAAQTWTNGTQYRVVATMEGTTIKTYVANVTKNSWASASSNQTATGLKVSHAGVDLVAWPRTLVLPSAA